MKRVCCTILAVGLLSAPAFAQAQAPMKPGTREPLVEFGMMTWPEVKAAMAAGKTTALIYTGGTEQRGPQNVNGGHTLMAQEIVKAIALRLGNALFLPVLPYTPNNASADLPGTIGLTPEILGIVLERISEQALATGFTNVILMGDHGGGQPATYADVAKKLDEKYAPKGKHVYFCDRVYASAQNDFDDWLVKNGYPRSSHAGIPDTSTMLYLGGDKGWVRKELIPTAEGDPVAERGQGGRGRGSADANAAPRKNNGISGDARRSTPELGKMAMDIKIDYAVKQIQGFLAGQKSSAQQ
ncbi:MAG TPA: creatininase family protein [Vicinamibacterales bacterium]|nr:creatininase family protein [Vicinamibacterales bacterium]